MSITRQIMLLIATPLLFLVAFLVLMTYMQQQAEENVRLSQLSKTLIARIYDLEGDLKDAQTHLRSHLLTGSPVARMRFNGAVAKVPGLTRQLVAMTGSGERHRLALEIQRLSEEQITFWQQVMNEASRGNRAGAVALFGPEGQSGVIDDLNGTIDRLLKEQQAIDVRRDEATISAWKDMSQVRLALTVLAVAISALFAYIVRRNVVRRLTLAVQDVQGSSAELQAVANQQAASSQEQAAATNEITTTMRELLATSRQIADSAVRVAGVAEETAVAAASGDQAVARSSEAVQSIRRQVEVIVGHMLDLGQKSQQVGGITEIIKELAEQTNIVAINATIEAAGAGEQGRRFSAVADEIRKLADRVGTSTKEIRILIDEIRAAVNQTVMATEQGTKVVDAGAAQFTDVAATFRRIVDQVQATVEAAREIELSTKQQTTAVEQVNAAITNVAQVAKEAEASSHQTLQTSNQLARLSRDLMRIIQVDRKAA